MAQSLELNGLHLDHWRTLACGTLQTELSLYRRSNLKPIRCARFTFNLSFASLLSCSRVAPPLLD